MCALYACELYVCEPAVCEHRFLFVSFMFVSSMLVFVSSRFAFVIFIIIAVQKWSWAVRAHNRSARICEQVSAVTPRSKFIFCMSNEESPKRWSDSSPWMRTQRVSKLRAAVDAAAGGAPPASADVVSIIIRLYMYMYM